MRWRIACRRSRTSPTTRRGLVWPAAGGSRSPRVPGMPEPLPRSMEDRDRVLGRRLRVARLAGAMPFGVRRARREPDADRVPSAQAGARQVHVLHRPSRGAEGPTDLLHAPRRSEGVRRRWEVLRLTLWVASSPGLAPFGPCNGCLWVGIPAHCVPSCLPRCLCTALFCPTACHPPHWGPPPGGGPRRLGEHQRRGPEVGRVLVLDATYEPIARLHGAARGGCRWKDKAEVLERAEWELHSANTSIAVSVGIRLVSACPHPAGDTHRHKITRWSCPHSRRLHKRQYGASP